MTSSRNIAVFRHGATEYNLRDRYQGRIDVDLTPVGIEQVRIAVPALVRSGARRVISSPLLRAVRSAEIVAAAVETTVCIMPEFSERCMGVFEGLSRNEAALRFPLLYRRETMRDINWAPPGGESLDAVARRVEDGLWRLVETQRESSVLVTHATVARIIRWLFARVDMSAFFDYSLANGRFDVYDLSAYPIQRLHGSKRHAERKK